MGQKPMKLTLVSSKEDKVFTEQQARAIHLEGYKLGLQHGMHQGINISEKLKSATLTTRQKLKVPKSHYTKHLFDACVKNLKKLSGI